MPSNRGNRCAALSLPNVFATGAGNRLRGIRLFQGLLTNRTVFLPHNHTWLFSLGLAQNNPKLARATGGGAVKFQVSLCVRGHGD
jgi:hypothetical protein